jgi:hypothetical protein
VYGIVVAIGDCIDRNLEESIMPSIKISTLTEAERAVLTRIVEYGIKETRNECARSTASVYRQDLEHQEEVACKLLAKLRKPVAAN